MDASPGMLIEAGWIVTPDGGDGVDVVTDAVIAVRGTRIEYAGPAADVPAHFTGWPRLNARSDIVIPGLVNAHNHAAMTLLRGYADDMRLMEWLEQKIWPAEAHLTGDDVYWGTLAAAVEQIRAGITAFADMYFYMEDAARAVAESGMRAQLSRGLIGAAPDHERMLREGVELFEQWDGYDDDRITVGLGPHAPYTCPDGFIREVVQEARRLEAPIQIHLAETVDEIAIVARERRLTPVRWAIEIGLVERPLLAAHCVHVSAQDIDLLARHGVGVAHNPISNMKLASGIAPVADMIKAGVTVALGTDGACSTNHLNLFEEIRLATWAAKVMSGDATLLPAAQMLRMATVDGARALGYPDVGRIAEGYRADLAIISGDAVHLNPKHDVVSLVVYSAQTSDVATVMIHGRIVMQDRRIVSFDEQQLLENFSRRGLQLIERARRVQ